MNFLQLQYFLLLADNENVSNTAKLLHISQPSLSATIKKLEEEIGVPLFNRKGRNIVLSKYGKTYKAYVEEAFLSLDNGLQVIKKMQGTDEHTMNLGILSPYIWSEVLEGFENTHPEIRINRYSVEDNDFINQLIAGKIDMYIGGLNYIEDFDVAKVDYTPLYEDEMVLLLPERHRFAAKDAIDLRECRDENFIALDSSTNLQHFINDMFAAANYRPNVVMVCDYTFRDKMVAENHGIIVTTKYSALRTQVRGVTYVPISRPSEKRKLGIVWRKNREFSLSMEKFYEYTCSFYNSWRALSEKNP